MKKFILSFIFVILGLGVLLLIAPSFMNWDGYKQTAQDQIKNISGLDVIFGGDISLAILPSPSITLKQVTIRNPSFAAAPDIGSFAELHLGVALGPLFSQQVQVQDVRVIAPNVTLYTGENGQQNWQTQEIKSILSAKDAASNAVQENKNDANSPGGNNQNIAFSFDRIRLRDGAFRMIDGKTGSETNIERVTLRIDAGSETKPYNVKGGLSFSGEYIEINASALPPTDDNATYQTQAVISHEKSGLEISVEGQTDPINQTLVGALNVKSVDIKSALDAFDIDFDALEGNALALSSPLVASPQQLRLADLRGQVGVNQITGSAQIDLSPLLVNITLQSPQNQLNSFAGLNLRAATSGSSLLFNDSSLSLGQKNKIFLDGRLNTDNDIADFSIRAQFDDLPGILNLFKIETETLPNDLNVLSLQSTLTGPLKKLEYDAKIRALGGQASLVGRIAEPYDITSLAQVDLSLSHPNVERVLKSFMDGRAPVKGALSLQTTLQGGEENVSLSNIVAKLGPTDIKGNVKADLSGARAFYQANLTFTDFTLGEKSSALKAAQDNDSSSSASSRSSGSSPRWSDDKIDVEAFQTMNFDFDVTGRSLTVGNWRAVNPKIKAVLRDGVLDIQNLSGGLYDGQFDIKAQIKALPEQPISITASPKVQNVSLEPFITSFAGNDILKGKGRISLESSIQTSGRSQKKLIDSLTGQGSISGSSLVLEGIDLTQFARALSEESKPGDSIDYLWSGANRGGNTAFDTLDGAFNINKGVINFSKLDLDGADATISTTGFVSLPVWQINTDHTITFKGEGDVPPFTIKIKGPLDDPAQTFGQGLLEDYLKRKIQRKIQKELQGDFGRRIQDKLNDELGGGIGDALGGFLGGGARQQRAPANDDAPVQQKPAEQNAAPSAPSQRSPEAEALDGLLRGIFQ